MSTSGTPSPSSIASYLGWTHRFVRRQLWLGPVLAALGLGLIGWWVHTHVEAALKTKMEGELRTILDTDVQALEIWFKAQESTAATLAADTRVLSPVKYLVDLAKQEGTTDSVLLTSSQIPALRNHLKFALKTHGYHGFIVANREHRILASSSDEAIGKKALAGYEDFLKLAFADQPTVSRPFPSPVLLADEQGALKTGLPTMFVAAPIRDEKSDVIAVLGLSMPPETEFTKILRVARSGTTGETYAFDKEGLLLSRSRFEDQLRSFGLLPDRADSRSILNLVLRDPEVDLRKGNRPKKPRSKQSLTKMATNAIAGNSGFDVNGYRDYRGVPVVGAWKWLKEYGMGIATESDVAEAYRPLYILRIAVWGLLGLLAVSAAVIFVFVTMVEGLQRSARKAALEAKKLGQYALGEKIGAGANGTVYHAQHAMLRRPVAVKLLNVDRTNEATIARFEREVQLTSHLNHTNTISIYDYGRTPEGIFYYAMEYLDGINLDKLGKEFGPQPEGRVIYILQQICGSLAEAHGMGLIHRDLKPANIILNRRGGQYDVVKVLDFGLAKNLRSFAELELTAADSVVGTPLYLAPESVEHPDEVDARSDLYAVGAVGYFLLTGKPLFESRTLRDVLMLQVKTLPPKPSERLGQFIHPDLEEIIMRCLAKDPASRPQNALLLDEALAQCSSAGKWTRKEAEAWWGQNVARAPQESPTPANGETQAFAKVIISR